MTNAKEGKRERESGGQQLDFSLGRCSNGTYKPGILMANFEANFHYEICSIIVSHKLNFIGKNLWQVAGCYATLESRGN